MKTKKFNEVRLRTYAEYLKAGDLKCKKLYTALVASIAAEKTKEEKDLKPLFFLPILEIPQVFHEEWVYDEHYMPIYKGNKEKETISSVIQFFGINRCLFLHLFSKGNQKPELWGGKTLSVRPTVIELAQNIEELIDHLNYYADVKGNNYQFHLN